MGTVNIGEQIVHLRFRQPAVTEDMNQWFYNIFEPGVFSGGEITIQDTIDPEDGVTVIGNVVVNPFSILLETTTKQLIKVQTNESVSLMVTPTYPFIVCSFTWQNSTENYMDFFTKDFASIIPTDVILGEILFDINDIAIDIDYLKKKMGQLKTD